MNGRGWTPQELKLLNKLLEERKSDYEIARMLGRKRSSVRSRRDYVRPLPHDMSRMEVADPSVLAERDRRLSLNHTDLTAYLMGDPVPSSGQSALERRAG